VASWPLQSHTESSPSHSQHIKLSSMAVVWGSNLNSLAQVRQRWRLGGVIYSWNWETWLYWDDLASHVEMVIWTLRPVGDHEWRLSGHIVQLSPYEFHYSNELNLLLDVYIICDVPSLAHSGVITRNVLWGVEGYVTNNCGFPDH
jgi:hypothetical protein